MYRFDDFGNLDSQYHPDQSPNFWPLIDIEGTTSHIFNVAMVYADSCNSTGTHGLCYSFCHIQRAISIGNAACNDFSIPIHIMYYNFPFHESHYIPSV